MNPPPAGAQALQHDRDRQEAGAAGARGAGVARPHAQGEAAAAQGHLLPAAQAARRRQLHLRRPRQRQRQGHTYFGLIDPRLAGYIIFAQRHENCNVLFWHVTDRVHLVTCKSES